MAIDNKNVQEAVLFLRIEPVGAHDKKYSLQLSVQTGMDLAGKNETGAESVVVEISNRLSQNFYDFNDLLGRPARLTVFGAEQALNQLMELEKAIGAGIYQTFFPGNIGRTFEAFMRLLRRRKLKRLTLVISSQVPEILDLPFEMMRKEEDAEPVLLSYNDFHLVHTIETGLEAFRVSALEPLAPPLRILFVAALPIDLQEEQRLLEIEKEQELLFEALGPLLAEQEILIDFLDTATLADIEQSLRDGEHHIVHFSGHGVHVDFDKEKSGMLYLEGEDGRTIKVTGKELARCLEKYNTLRLVVLSACETAHSEDYGVAGALIDSGIPTVLGMRFQVSDDKVICFTSQFYRGICTGKSLSHAMFNGRTAINEHEKKQIIALRKNESQDFVFPEWMTPFLYQNQEIFHLIDYSLERTDPRYFFQEFVNLVQGGKYVGRGFVGRRKEILTLHRLFQEGKRSVCIYGQGGLGKTTLAIRFADNYENGAYKIVQLRNEVTEETILTTLAEEASEYLGDRIIKIVQSSKNQPLDKLNILIEQFLSRHKIIILFDDFEENQVRAQLPGGEEQSEKVYQQEIHSGSLKAFLKHLCSNLEQSSYIIFTTRYLFPEPEVITLNLCEMGVADSYKLLARQNNLFRLPTYRKRLVHNMLGGHPHAFGLLEKYIGIKDMSWEDIKRKFQEIQDKEFNQNLLLDMLWKQLTKDEQTVLMGASVFRDLTAPEGLTAVTGLSSETVKQAVKTLNSFSLLYVEEGWFHVHRLTSDFVRNTRMSKEKRLEYHRRAAEYFAGIRNKEGKKHIGNDIEARWHFLQAEEWDRAAEVMFNFDYALRIQGYPQLSFELLKEMEGKRISDKNRAILYHLIGMSYLHFGDHEQAIEMYNKSLELSKKIEYLEGIAHTLGNLGLIAQNNNDFGPALLLYKESMEIAAEIDDLKTIAESLHNIGIICQLICDFDAAMEHFQQSIEIKKKIDDLPGIPECLHQMAMIHEKIGDYNSALNLYKKAGEISGVFWDMDALSSTYHQIGNLYCRMGDYDAAFEQYNRSLEIKEQTGNLKGIATSLHQLGMFYHEKGDFDKALIHYRKSIEISEQIDDRHSIPYSLHQMGRLFQQKGDYNEALKHYRKALELHEQNRNIEGMATTYGQMGMFYYEKGEFHASLECSVQAFLICSQIGSPKAMRATQDILAIRDKLPESEYNKILEKYDIPPKALENAETEIKRIKSG